MLESTSTDNYGSTQVKKIVHLNLFTMQSALICYNDTNLSALSIINQCTIKLYTLHI